MPHFRRKLVLYSSTKFAIIKPWTNIPWPKRLDLGFWQTSKQIYRKLEYREKTFREFNGLRHFPIKMILYSSTKFGIIKPWEAIFLGANDSIEAFDRLQNKSIGNSNIRRKLLESLTVCLTFPEKWISIPRPNLALQSLEPIFNQWED